MRDCDQQPTEVASSSDACDCSANNQSCRCWCCSTHCRSNLKDNDRSNENPLDGKEAVELAKKELEGTESEQVGASC